MEQLIAELYSPANQSSPERVNDLQREIQLIQRQKSAWQLGLDLLRNDEAVMRFYGALTLTIKINADWDKDDVSKDDQMRSYLLEALLASYVHLVSLSDTNFVLQKLCSTLSTFFARPDSGWEFPVRHVLACLLQGKYIVPHAVPPMTHLLQIARTAPYNQLKGIIMVTTTMAEDLTASSTSGGRVETNLQDRLHLNCSDTWRLMNDVIIQLIHEAHVENNHQRPPSLPDRLDSNHSAELFRLILQGMPFWAGVLRQARSSLEKNDRHDLEAVARHCIHKASKGLTVDGLTAGVLQMLISLQQTSARLLQQAIPGFPDSIIQSQKARQLLDSLLRGEVDPDGVLYVDLLEAILTQVDTTAPQYLRDDGLRGVIQTVQQLLWCAGIPAVDDTVSQIALEKISEMVEGYTDWEEDKIAAGALKAIAADACQACLSKIKLPLEQMSSETDDWDADDRSKFQYFRYDVQDFFQSAFVLLGNNLIEEIVNTTLLQGENLDWSTFEAGIFSLTAFSDIMSAEPAMYDGLITTVLSSQGWTAILSSSKDVPDRVRQTGIRFITENVVYLQRHPDSLVLILNFLFSSLQLPSSAAPASRAIYKLCDSHRGVLSEGLPQFMMSLGSIAALGEAERHRIYAGVAAIIQALPSEEAKVGPLSQLLSSASTTLTDLTVGAEDWQESLRVCTDVLQTLGSIGKGLREPSDLPVDLEAPDQESTKFWTHGPGQSVQAEALGLCQAAMQRVGHHADNAVVEAFCDFIRAGFTEQHPSPFKFEDVISLDLVTGLISLENPNLDYTMACASSFISSVARVEVDRCIQGLVHPIVLIQERILGEIPQMSQSVSSTFSSSSLELLGHLMTKWDTPVWYEMRNGNSILSPALELGLVLLADPDTLPRRLAASFFGAFVDFSASRGEANEEAQIRTRKLFHGYAPKILARVFCLLGGECARSELESITDVLKRAIQKQPMVTKQVLREAVQEDQRVLSEKALRATTIEQRTRFLAQVENLRGSRKTNEIVKDFWIACRGSGFGYIV